MALLDVPGFLGRIAAGQQSPAAQVSAQSSSLSRGPQETVAHLCADPLCAGRHLGEWAWLGIVAFVAAWDLYSPDPATAAFRRARQRNLPVVTFAWGTTTLHLFGLLPRRYDPFYRFCDLAGVRRHRCGAGITPAS